MVILYIQVMEVFLSHHLLYRQEAVQALVLVQEVVTMIMAAILTTVQETTADIQPVQEVVMKTVTVQETTYQVQAAITIQGINGNSSYNPGNNQSGSSNSGNSQENNNSTGSDGKTSSDIGEVLNKEGFTQEYSNVYVYTDGGTYYGEIITQPDVSIIYIKQRNEGLRCKNKRCVSTAASWKAAIRYGIIMYLQQRTVHLL